MTNEPNKNLSNCARICAPGSARTIRFALRTLGLGSVSQSVQLPGYAPGTLELEAEDLYQSLRDFGVCTDRSNTSALELQAGLNDPLSKNQSAE